jgi:23S rRNA pseudouridine955/2504/2580 synthase
MPDIKILQDQDGMRLDRFLRKKLFFNQSLIEKSLRFKKILVNNHRAKSNDRLQIDDIIFVDESLTVENLSNNKGTKTIPEQLKELIYQSIITANDNFCVINKPAGIAVQSGTKIKYSIDDILPKSLKKLDLYLDESIEHKLVHRLDKETSGILLVALNNQYASFLAKQFAEKTIQKKYYAILNGRLKKHTGIVSSKLLNETTDAISKYKIVASHKNFSLVEFMPITGKKHQLRIHALELKHPILGDNKYFLDSSQQNEDHLFLHARSIELPGKFYFYADFPDYFLNKIVQIFGEQVKKQLTRPAKDNYNYT